MPNESLWYNASTITEAIAVEDWNKPFGLPGKMSIGAELRGEFDELGIETEGDLKENIAFVRARLREKDFHPIDQAMVQRMYLDSLADGSTEKLLKDIEVVLERDAPALGTTESINTDNHEMRVLTRSLQKIDSSIETKVEQTYSRVNGLSFGVENPQGVISSRLPGSEEDELRAAFELLEEIEKLKDQASTLRGLLNDKVGRLNEHTRRLSYQIKPANLDSAERRRRVLGDRTAAYLEEVCIPPAQESASSLVKEYMTRILGARRLDIFTGWYGRGLRQNVLAEISGMSAPTVNRAVKEFPELARQLGAVCRVRDSAAPLGLEAIMPYKGSGAFDARNDLLLVDGRGDLVAEVQVVVLDYVYPTRNAVLDVQGNPLPGYGSFDKDGNGLWVYPATFGTYEEAIEDAELPEYSDQGFFDVSNLVPETIATSIFEVARSYSSRPQSVIAIEWGDDVLSFHMEGRFDGWPREWWSVDFDEDGAHSGYSGPGDIDEWFSSTDPNSYRQFIRSFTDVPQDLASCLKTLADPGEALDPASMPDDAAGLLEWIAGD